MPTSVFLERCHGDFCTAAAASLQGLRSTMEDKHVLALRPDSAVLAVLSQTIMRTPCEKHYEPENKQHATENDEHQLRKSVIN